jgi:molybdate transport system substrate-binding protein
MKKGINLGLILLLLLTLGLSGCGKTDTPPAQTTAEPETITLTVAAASNLEPAYVTELIPRFRASHPAINIEGIYDSSANLQTQIEVGLAADVFMPAATRQMDALTEAKLIDAGTVIPLLENKIVLIKAAGTETAVTSFATATDAATIAIGDPSSVLLGQYTREIFTNLSQWEAVSAQASLAANAGEIVNALAAGSAEVGVVYATDAAASDQVVIIAEAPASSLTQPVIYPAGILAGSSHPKEAQLFIDFLQSPEALKIFSTYGFSAK